MRILVVDDEQIMLDAISKILQNQSGIQLETARTGREAIEKASTFLPQLIMMDIKIPGLNGLEALAEIRRINPLAVSVIISAYDHFNYAQEAIRLCVFDYLLKPVSKTRLLELIDKVQKHLEHLRSLRQTELTLREQHQKLLPLIEAELVQALQTGVNPASFREYQEMLGLEFDAGFFCAIAHPEEPESGVTPLEHNYLMRERRTRMADSLRQRFQCLIASRHNNPLPVFFPLNRAEVEEAGAVNYRENLINKVLAYLQNEHFSVKSFRIGIGSMAFTPDTYRQSCQEALQALNTVADSPLCFYTKPAPPDAWEIKLDAEFQSLTEAIRFGHLYRVETCCRNLAEQYCHWDGPSKEQLIYHLLEVVLVAQRITRETCKESFSYPPIRTLLAMFDCSADLSGIFAQITPILTALTRRIKELRETQVNTVIIKAKQIIDRFYQNDLSLEELAHSVSVSPFYLSHLFREELGIGFAEYLTRVRMEKSRTLLVQGLSVKECSFAVGYNDPNYFSRLFRKYYQLSPSEYREATLSRKGGNPYDQFPD